jgi:hypothetical protein
MKSLLKSKKSKKGSIVDVAFLLVAILGIAIFILIVGYIFPQITGAIKTNSPIGNNTASVAALDSSDNIISRFDYIFLTIFVGLSISVLISSFFIDSSPILIPVYIIALGILIIFAVVAENIYESFAESATFAATAATHPITNYVMSHLIMVAIGVGVLSMVLIFAKPKGNSGYGGY